MKFLLILRQAVGFLPMRYFAMSRDGGGGAGAGERVTVESRGGLSLTVFVTRADFA